MGNASSSSRSHGSSDSDNESTDHDMDDVYDAVHSAVVGGGHSSSAAGQLAMSHSIYYDRTKLVTDFDAVNVFGLKHSELRKLKYQKRVIPGVSRHGMRLKVQTALYNRSEIEELAKKKQEALEAKQQARRNKELARHQRRRQAAGAAKDQIRKFSGCKRARSNSDADEKHGDVKLPDAVLQKVVGCLAAFEAGGVRGPTMVANDLASAMLVSWDFHNAAKHGFTLLQQQVEQLQFNSRGCYSYHLERGLKRLPTADGWTWQQWNTFLSDPLPYKLPELKLAAIQLSISRSGTKAELVVRLLAAFGLKAPSKAPPQLLRALALERISDRPWEGVEELLAPRSAFRSLFLLTEGQDPGLGFTREQFKAATTAASWRKLLMASGIESKTQLMELKRRADARHAEVAQQAQQAAQAAMQAAMAEQQARHAQQAAHEAQEAAVQEPAVQEPAVQEPAVQERAVQEAAVQEAAVQEPAVQEPAAHEAQQEAVQEPAVQEPAVQEPAVQEPAVQEPAVQEPAVQEPAVQEPAVHGPAVQEPAVHAAEEMQAAV